MNWFKAHKKAAIFTVAANRAIDRRQKWWSADDLLRAIQFELDAMNFEGK